MSNCDIYDDEAIVLITSNYVLNDLEMTKYW